MASKIYFDESVHHPKYKRLYAWWTAKRVAADPIHLENRAEIYRKNDIKMCKEWYYDFAVFADYCYSIGWEDGQYIHLKDGCTTFAPGNIEFHDYRYDPRIIWVEFDGVAKSVYRWCKELGLSYNAVMHQIERGKPAKEAIEHVQSQKKTGCSADSAD